MNFKYPIECDIDYATARPSCEIDMAKIRPYIENDVLATKQYLNSIYGTQGEKYMNRKYIVVIVDNEPTIIFTDKIISVTKSASRTMITCVGDVNYYASNSYVDVVKMLLK